MSRFRPARRDRTLEAAAVLLSLDAERRKRLAVNLRR
jgi:hypothetical protein